MQRYLTDNIERSIVPMQVTAKRVVDERGNPDVMIVWQDDRAKGLVPATWSVSDAARISGSQAMLYSSRSRPDLSHIVVFDPECLSFVGPVRSM